MVDVWVTLITLITDNFMIIIIIFVSLPIITFVILFTRWYKFGRDEKKILTSVHELAPPENLTPAQIGIIFDDKSTYRDLTAEILFLAVKGYVKIEKISGQDNPDFILHLTKDSYSKELATYQSMLLASIFVDAKSVKVSEMIAKLDVNYSLICGVVWKSVIDSGYYTSDPRSVHLRYAMSAFLFIFLGILLIRSGLLIGQGLSVLLCGVIIFLFASYMPARTKRGVDIWTQINGFKQYLEVAEKERIDKLSDPNQNDANVHIESNLPYAVVLGIEKDWPRVFSHIYQKFPEKRCGGLFVKIEKK